MYPLLGSELIYTPSTYRKAIEKCVMRLAYAYYRIIFLLLIPICIRLSDSYFAVAGVILFGIVTASHTIRFKLASPLYNYLYAIFWLYVSLLFFITAPAIDSVASLLCNVVALSGFVIIYLYFLLGNSLRLPEPAMWASCLVSLVNMAGVLQRAGNGLRAMKFDLSLILITVGILAPAFILFMTTVKKDFEEDEEFQQEEKHKREGYRAMALMREMMDVTHKLQELKIRVDSGKISPADYSAQVLKLKEDGKLDSIIEFAQYQPDNGLSKEFRKFYPSDI